MKKILSLLATTSLIASTSSSVISCNNAVKNLSYVSGKSASDLLTASVIEINGNKLAKEYSGSYTPVISSDINIEVLPGTPIENSNGDQFDLVKILFNESKDLSEKSSNMLVVDGVTTEVPEYWHMFLYKGILNARNFNVYLIKINFVVTTTDGVNTFNGTFEALNKLNVTIPTEETTTTS